MNVIAARLWRVIDNLIYLTEDGYCDLCPVQHTCYHRLQQNGRVNCHDLLTEYFQGKI